MGLCRFQLHELAIEDRDSFRHVGLFEDLSTILKSHRYTFLAPEKGRLSWGRALLLNLAFWKTTDIGAGEELGGDVLTEKSIPADVVMHAAWHHLADLHLEPSVEANLLGESIASAFDLYLVGRLLGHSPDSQFLATQVPQMADIAEDAGTDEEGFEALLERISADPDKAFEELRSLLFTVSVDLSRAGSAIEAAEKLGRFENHPFAALLHHYEISSWVLEARAHLSAGIGEGKPAENRPRARSAKEIDAALTGAKSSVDWLEKNWVRPLLETEDAGGQKVSPRRDRKSGVAR